MSVIVIRFIMGNPSCLGHHMQALGVQQGRVYGENPHPLPSCALSLPCYTDKALETENISRDKETTLQSQRSSERMSCVEWAISCPEGGKLPSKAEESVLLMNGMRMQKAIGTHCIKDLMIS
ncbi:hypothetical protein M8J75_012426 [Diaphorina citri]|nr:hypothetical protein M8J75_012426 [Diaphorina citri]